MEKAKNLHIKSVLWHNDIVVRLATLIELNKEKLPLFVLPDWDLIRRVVCHDFDKFADNYSNGITNYLFNKGEKKVDAVLSEFNAHKHKETQTHHIEYHLKNKTKPSDLDICEMVCDWIASSRKYYNDNVYEKKQVKNYWTEVVFNDNFPETKNFINENEPEKFKSIADFFDTCNLKDDFFGADPCIEFFREKNG
ncbi:MAG: hypothetical protein Ta2D_00260 [Rickettsiales bacterium]|nr:MAG: hypothetical protein Ta2D_00260 [Rickettsiales bacterium]